jgi:hypothetical protein
MLYITGDTHRDFRRVLSLCDTVNPTRELILFSLPFDNYISTY